MSWMDSWSRPSKSQATPPPYYLLPGGDKTPYCHRCGRIIGDRKTKTGSAAATPAKYCSSRCKTSRQDKALNQRIEDTFVALMNGLPVPGAEDPSLEPSTESSNGKGKAAPNSSKKKKKGESRVLVDCGDVEKAVFGDRDDPDKRFGRRKNRARRGVKDGDVWKSVDMESDESDDDQHDEAAESKEGILSLTKTQSKNSKFTGDSLENESSEEDKEANGGLSITSHVPSAAESGTQLDADVIARLSIRSGTRIRPSQEVSEVNGGVGGEKGLKERIVEGEDMLQKRREGQKKADQRELVRCAARRGVAFGFVVKNRGEKDEQRRLCEAVMQGKVVESSFAKGEWGIRWRE